MAHEVRLRHDQIAKYRELTGKRRQKDVGDAAGLTETGIYRILEGRSLPANKTIAGLLVAFAPVKFEDLFEIIDTEVSA